MLYPGAASKIGGASAIQFGAAIPIIRFAEVHDMASITEIYNDAVRSSEGTQDIECKLVSQMLAWFHERGPEHPIIVGTWHGEVMGWASISAFSRKCGYSQTAETSLYVHQKARGLGLGKKLKKQTMLVARDLGFHSIISRVVSTNEPCNALNISLGFELVGVFKEVGYKFGRYHNMNFYQYIFNDKK